MEKATSKDSELVSEKIRDRIANRNNWVRLGIFTVFAAVGAYKLARQPIVINLADFKFQDLLSLLLAVFSVSLSVVFYFKATDTSNEFYHHSYTFTKDISIILGRIEASFGERLRHLDEGYSGLRDLVEEKGDRQPHITTAGEIVANPESRTSEKKEG